jgi:hypothetical protein
VAAAPAAPAPAPEPLKLAEADPPDVVAWLVMPSVDRTMQSGVALARQVMPVPLDATGLKNVAAMRAGLPQELVSALDLGRPSAMVLTFDAETRNAHVVFALPLASKDAFLAGLGKLGAPVARRGEAAAYAQPGGGTGQLWTLVEGELAYLGDEAMAIERGARTAAKLTVTPVTPRGADLVVTTWPEKMKLVSGFDLEAGANMAVQRMTMMSSMLPNAEMLITSGTAVLPAMAKLFSEARTIQLVGLASAQDGVTASVRLEPRPGTTLEAIAKSAPAPIKVPGVLVEGRPLAVFAMGARPAGEPTPIWDALIKGFSASQNKAVKAAAAIYRLYFENGDGSMAMSFGGGKGGMRMDGVFGFKDADAGKRYMDTFTKDGGKALQEMMKGMGMGPNKDAITIKMKTEKVAGKKALVTIIDVPKGRPERELLEKVYGKLPALSYIVQADKRMAMAFNGDAKARLGKTLKSQAADPAEPTFKRALGAGQRTGLVWVDVAAYAGMIGELMGPQASASMNALTSSPKPVPFVVDWGVDGSGPAPAVDASVRLPITLFQGLGRQFGKM